MENSEADRSANPSHKRSFDDISAKDFQQLAGLLAPSPAPWLAEHLFSWACSLYLDRNVFKKQPSRAHVRKSLKNIQDAALTILHSLNDGAIRDFLDAGGSTVKRMHGNFEAVFRDLADSAQRASYSPMLANKAGKTRAGRGPAMPEGAISAQVYCALLIAETWKYFRGKYPAPRNRQAAQAAALLWQLVDGETSHWGNETLTAWRHHFKSAQSARMLELRQEHSRHLHEADRLSKQFDVGQDSKKGH
ncbi:MAG: hypothetical protein WDM89_07025 [Rhizomicrobium sp.]